MVLAQLGTPAELKLLEASANGEIADFSSIDPLKNNPLAGEHWTEHRTLSAEVVRALVMGNNSRWSTRPAGVRIVGARIVGMLGLADANIPFPLAFVKCSFERELSLSGASVESVFLGGS